MGFLDSSYSIGARWPDLPYNPLLPFRTLFSPAAFVFPKTVVFGRLVAVTEFSLALLQLHRPQITTTLALIFEEYCQQNLTYEVVEMKTMFVFISACNIDFLWLC